MAELEPVVVPALSLLDEFVGEPGDRLDVIDQWLVIGAASDDAAGQQAGSPLLVLPARSRYLPILRGSWSR